MSSGWWWCLVGGNVVFIWRRSHWHLHLTLAALLFFLSASPLPQAMPVLLQVTHLKHPLFSSPSSSLSIPPVLMSWGLWVSEKLWGDKDNREGMLALWLIYIGWLTYQQDRWGRQMLIVTALVLSSVLINGQKYFINPPKMPYLLPAIPVLSSHTEEGLLVQGGNCLGWLILLAMFCCWQRLQISLVEHSHGWEKQTVAQALSQCLCVVEMCDHDRFITALCRAE